VKKTTRTVPLIGGQSKLIHMLLCTFGHILCILLVRNVTIKYVVEWTQVRFGNR